MTTWFLGFDPAVKAAKAVDPYAYGNRINGLITGLEMAKLKPQPLREIFGILVRLDAPSPELQKRQSEAENHIDMAAGNADVRDTGTAEVYRKKAITTLNMLRAETERFINDQKPRRGKTAKVTKAEYWVDPLKTRFAISQLEQVLPDEVNSPRTLQVIAQRCDDIAAKLPTRENPGMEDTAFALKKAAGEFRIASRLLNEPPKFSQSYTRAKQYVHAALIKVSGIPGAHRSVDETVKAADELEQEEARMVAPELRNIQRHIKQIQQQTVSPKTAIKLMHEDARYLNEAAERVSAASGNALESAAQHLTKAAGFLSARKQTESLNMLTFANAMINKSRQLLMSGE